MHVLPFKNGAAFNLHSSKVRQTNKSFRSSSGKMKKRKGAGSEVVLQVVGSKPQSRGSIIDCRPQRTKQNTKRKQTKPESSVVSFPFFHFFLVNPFFILFYFYFFLLFSSLFVHSLQAPQAPRSLSITPTFLPVSPILNSPVHRTCTIHDSHTLVNRSSSSPPHPPPRQRSPLLLQTQSPIRSTSFYILSHTRTNTEGDVTRDVRTSARTAVLADLLGSTNFEHPIM